MNIAGMFHTKINGLICSTGVIRGKSTIRLGCKERVSPLWHCSLINTGELGPEAERLSRDYSVPGESGTDNQPWSGGGCEGRKVGETEGFSE